MRILFAIQGTGNGHLTRARDVYPELCRHAEVDVLISGCQADVAVPFPVKRQLHGMSFIFGKRGGVDMLATVLRLRLRRCMRDARALNVSQYDLVVNDFEPVSAWAARFAGVPCVSLSHQWAVLQPNAPRQRIWDLRGIVVLRYYAPVKWGYGFHFQPYGKRIFTPVIRKEVRALKTSNEGHITVYLPAYNDAKLVAHLQQFPEVHWQVFSKHTKSEHTEGNVYIRPISGDAFLNSMAASAGVLCGAGFEGPAEALFLQKKVMVVPMDGQYEQGCNAAALEQMGVPVILKLHPKYYSQISLWLSGATEHVRVDYPDQTAAIVDELMNDYKARYGRQHSP